jgi:hypothetical protein
MEPVIPRMNKKAFKVTDPGDSSDEDRYWKTGSFEERLNAIEVNRRLVYGVGVKNHLSGLQMLEKSCEASSNNSTSPFSLKQGTS